MNNEWTIFCPGPSLSKLSVKKLRYDPEHSIAVNGAILKDVKVAYWAIMDYAVFTRCVKEVKTEDMKLWIPENWNNHMHRWCPDLNDLFKQTKKETYPGKDLGSIMPFNKDFSWAEYSVFAAIALAVLKGAKTIKLYGADMRGEGYFVKNLENIKTDHKNSRWGRELELFVVLQDACLKRGIKIIKKSIVASIIIPTHNNWDCTKNCIDAIIKNTNSYEIIFVMDNSVEFQDKLRTYGEVILTNRPFIFAHRVNLGIEAAVGKYICILNDDTLPRRNWLEEMISSCEQLGPTLVGARTQHGGCSNQEAYNGDFSWETANTLNMFAVLIPRRVLDVVGLLDERFAYYGGEDDDYCLRAIRHGFWSVISKGFVEHVGGLGCKDEGYRLLPKTDQVFKEKWGTYQPRDIPKERWNDFTRKHLTMPLISILMPTLNHEEYIKDAIESVLKQSYKNFELLIGIDGLPQTKTGEVIQKFQDPRIKIYIKQQSIGSCNMRNKLFERSKGEFIVLMDSDDIMLPDRIKNQLEAMKPDVDIIHSAYKEEDISGGIKVVSHGAVDKKQLCFDKGWIAGGTFFMRRHVLEKEKFDENYARAFDYEYTLRNFEKFKFRFLDKPTLIYRRHAGEHLCGNAESTLTHGILREKYRKELI